MIRIEHLSKSFGSLEVLNDISFEVRDGETLAVIGRSGSGKSVLMKHMVGLLTPDSGHIHVDEHDLCCVEYERLRDLRKRFGVLFQGGALFDSMNTFENIAFPLEYFSDKTSSEIEARVKECLNLVRLEGVGPKNPSDLSGGMRKRVALARAIALAPRYILYDEPTSGLDPETSNTINELISQLSTDLNVTSVVVTHDMHSVLTTADRVAFLHDTHLHWIGPVEALHDRPDPVLDEFVRASEYHLGDTSPSVTMPRGS
ncbi:MAG: ABC transporter ATP-binding protein [Salinivenus sp.]